MSSSERIGAAVGSSMNLGFQASADAYAVLDAVDAQDALASMLREYALMGATARPDWAPHPATRVERGKTGNALHVDPRGRCGLYPFRLFVHRGDLPAVVEERRRNYGDSARAIHAVHAALSARGRLTAQVLAPRRPERLPGASLLWRWPISIEI